MSGKLGGILPTDTVGLCSGFCLLLSAFCLSPFPAAAQTKLPLADARNRMVDEEIVGAGIKNPRVIQAMRDTPRHEFVLPQYRQQAYFDMSLPIGDKQTISGPFVVAYMTEQLDPQPDDRVLEIGTGSGYQAAVLSPLVKDVYTIEIVETLGKRAEQTLERLKYKNVHVKIGDGYQGWPEHAPFDKIIVTCSPEKVPQPLVDQLKEGGKMIVPVGERFEQILYRFTKKDGQLVAEPLRPTLFVPMTGTAEAGREVQPDPLHPHMVNGSFEEQAGTDGEPRGWYYCRQMKVVQSDEPFPGRHDNGPEGKSYLSFTNDVAGRMSRALQGFAVDGKKIGQIEVSAMIRGQNIVGRSVAGRVATNFTHVLRRQLGHHRSHFCRPLPRHVRLAARDGTLARATGRQQVHHAHRLAGRHGTVRYRRCVDPGDRAVV